MRRHVYFLLGVFALWTITALAVAFTELMVDIELFKATLAAGGFVGMLLNFAAFSAKVYLLPIVVSLGLLIRRRKLLPAVALMVLMVFALRLINHGLSCLIDYVCDLAPVFIGLPLLVPGLMAATLFLTFLKRRNSFRLFD